MLVQLKHLVENIQQVARELSAMEYAHRDQLALAADYIKFQAMVRAIRNGLAFSPIQKTAGDSSLLTLREGVLVAVKQRDPHTAQMDEQELWLLQDGTFLETHRTGTKWVWKREKAPLQKEPFLHWGAKTVAEGLLRVLEGQVERRKERLAHLSELLGELRDVEEYGAVEALLQLVQGELSYAPIRSNAKGELLDSPLQANGRRLLTHATRSTLPSSSINKETDWLGKGALLTDRPDGEQEHASRELWLLEDGTFFETLFYGSHDGYHRNVAAQNNDPLTRWSYSAIAKGITSLLERERSQQQRLLEAEEQLAAEVRDDFFPFASAGVPSARRTSRVLMQKRSQRLMAQAEECRAELEDLPDASLRIGSPSIAECIAACLPLFSFDTKVRLDSGECDACLLDDEQQPGTKLWRELYVTRDGRFWEVRYRESEEVNGAYVAGVHEVEKELDRSRLDGWSAQSVLQRMLTWLDYLLEDVQDQTRDMAEGFRVFAEELI